MKVIDSLWFTNIRGTAGLVVTEDEKTGVRKARVGVVYGHDEKTDQQDVAELGTEISADQLLRVTAMVREAKLKEPEQKPSPPAPPAPPAKPEKIKKAREK